MSMPLQRGRDKTGYLSLDTIAAQATASGGAVAIVRVSGPRAFESLVLLSRSPEKALAEPRKLFLAKLYGVSGSEIDEALFVRFVSPDSFTGEDVVEYHIHGGAFTCSRLLEELRDSGIRQALPGEFSFRAVRNGKMSITQSQAVADLIAASSEPGVTLALEKLSGTQNHLISELATGLRRITTLAEAGIDFSDQNIDEVSVRRQRADLLPILGSLEKLHQSYDRGMRIMDGVRVAFVGLPNAGKSSFFNALLGESRSIVSPVPGTTRDVIREHLTLRGKGSSVSLRLEDTAGLRKTGDAVETLGVERTFKAAREADLVLFLVDAATGATAGPVSNYDAAREQWAALHVSAKKVLGIITKADLVSPSELELVRKNLIPFGIARWVATSALNAHGMSEAADEIVSFSERWTKRDRGEVVLTRLNHVEAVSETMTHLRRATQVEESDLFSADLRQALASLAPLIGDTLPEDILGRIFSEFCVGK